MIISLFLLLGATEGWVNLTGTGEPQLEVMQSDASGLTIQVNVPGFYQTSITQQGKTYQKIRFSNEATTQDIGKPALPTLNAIVGVPDNQQFRYHLTNVETATVSNMLIYPYQTPEKDVAGGKSEEFMMDKRFYDTNSQYPVQFASMDKPGIWRDVVISGLHVVPFQYNPATRQLEVITSCTVEIEFYGYDADTAINRDKAISPCFTTCIRQL